MISRELKDKKFTTDDNTDIDFDSLEKQYEALEIELEADDKEVKEK